MLNSKYVKPYLLTLGKMNTSIFQLGKKPALATLVWPALSYDTNFYLSQSTSLDQSLTLLFSYLQQLCLKKITEALGLSSAPLVFFIHF